MDKQLFDKVMNCMLGDRSDNSHMNFTVWEWPTAIGVYSIYKAYLKTNDKQYLNLLIKWFDDRIAEGLPPKNVNSVGPLLTMAHVYEITGREDYLAICKEWLDWVMNEMPRTQEGGLEHMTVNGRHYEQMWVDTLFMTVLFVAKMGKITGDQKVADEATYQFLIHIKYLTNTKTGLWHHAFCFDGRHNYSGAPWARGNSWYASSVQEFIDITGIDGAVKRFLVETLKSQLDALVKYQGPEGFWHTLMDDDSYNETSATASFAYSMIKAVKSGLVEDNGYLASAKKAVAAVKSVIEDDGTVGGVSYGTGAKFERSGYTEVPIRPTTYGQGLTLMMLTVAD